MSRNFLSKNEELRRGDYLVSNNGNFKAVFQDDGNFVIYGWKPVWVSDTDQSDVFHLYMQGDYNLVTYNKADVPRWQTNCCKGSCNICSLHRTDDGRLVVCREGNEIWSSVQNRGMK